MMELSSFSSMMRGGGGVPDTGVRIAEYLLVLHVVDRGRFW